MTTASARSVLTCADVWATAQSEKRQKSQRDREVVHDLAEEQRRGEAAYAVVHGGERNDDRVVGQWTGCPDEHGQRGEPRPSPYGAVDPLEEATPREMGVPDQDHVRQLVRDDLAHARPRSCGEPEHHHVRQPAHRAVPPRGAAACTEPESRSTRCRRPRPRTSRTTPSSDSASSASSTQHCPGRRTRRAGRASRWRRRRER